MGKKNGHSVDVLVERDGQKGVYNLHVTGYGSLRLPITEERRQRAFSTYAKQHGLRLEQIFYDPNTDKLVFSGIPGSYILPFCSSQAGCISSLDFSQLTDNVHRRDLWTFSKSKAMKHVEVRG